MPNHSDDIKLALWKNDKRKTDRHPILRGGKPQVIDGKEYWVSAWINAPKDDHATAEAIERMVDKLTNGNGNYPLVTVSLSPAEASAPAAGGPGPDDDLPF